MSKQRVPRGIIWLGVVSLLNDLSSEVTLRALPLYLLGVVHTGFLGLGLVEGVSEATGILGRLFAGYFSDKMARRKPFLLAGYGLSVVARPFLLFKSTVLPALFSRFFDRVGKSIRTSPRDALIADLSSDSDRGRNFGIHRAMDTIGALFGVGGVAAFLYFFSPSNDKDALWWIMAVAAILGALAIPVIVIFIHDPHPTGGVKVKTKPKLALSQMDERLKKYLFVSFLFAVATSSDAFLVARAKELHFSILDIFLILTGFNLVSVPAYAFLTNLSDSFGRKTMLMAGWVIYGLCYLIFGSKDLTPAAFVAVMLVYSTYYGFTDGVEKAMVADFERGEKKGQSYGWLALVQGIGVIPANLGFGYIYQKIGYSEAFWFSGTMALLGVAALFFFNPNVSESK